MGEGNRVRPVVGTEAEMRRPAGRRARELMALAFAVALVHFVCRKNTQKATPLFFSCGRPLGLGVR